ncbi:uncharacterized protein LOC106164048 [Lingula anatina]|uniref:Uncharacterized protein LOC106164048 n=1 Tax=Lingula anatina TaxID=7574 RepID=A0A1S3IGM3_LINAN|nr:uncharacterized protein LOC106164048 [Lingula anatina]|eukprot:XP_013397288.1 uncharacterized protein LOC106164048 [Lingula anatina]
MVSQIRRGGIKLFYQTSGQTLVLRHAKNSSTSWMYKTKVVIPKIDKDKYIPTQRRDTVNVRVDVCYIDTGRENHNAKGKTAIILHDIPGSHKDLFELITQLAKNGVRVIVPNFPELGFSEVEVPVEKKYGGRRWSILKPVRLFAAYLHWMTGSPHMWQVLRKQTDYVHSTKERANFLLAFLDTIGVRNPDVVVAHGLNAYPALMIGAHVSWDIFRTIVLVTPTPHKPCKAFRPYFFTCLLADYWQFNYLNRPFVLLALRWLGRRIGQSHLPVAHIAASAMAMREPGEQGAHGTFYDVKTDGIIVKEKKIPLTYIMSENDKLIEANLSMEFAKILGVTEEQFDKYKGGVIQKKATSQWEDYYTKGVSIDDGTHFVQGKYTELVANEILDVLKHMYNVQSTYYLPVQKRKKIQLFE